MTKPAQMTIAYETDLTPKQVAAKADHVHVMGYRRAHRLWQFPNHGHDRSALFGPDNERDRDGRHHQLPDPCRRCDAERAAALILLVRETPLHLGHLRTMTALTEMGAIIMPPVPAFYAEPRNMADLVDQMVGRALDLFGLDWPMKRWGEDLPTRKRGKRT